MQPLQAKPTSWEHPVKGFWAPAGVRDDPREVLGQPAALGSAQVILRRVECRGP